MFVIMAQLCEGRPRAQKLLGSPDPLLARSKPRILLRGKDQLTRIDTSRHGLRQKAAESLPKSTSI